MDLTLFQIGSLGGFVIFGVGISLYLYIDGLKYRLRNLEIDRDFYRRMYELEKEYADVGKKHQQNLDLFGAE